MEEVNRRGYSLRWVVEVVVEVDVRCGVRPPGTPPGGESPAALGSEITRVSFSIGCWTLREILKMRVGNRVGRRGDVLVGGILREWP